MKTKSMSPTISDVAKHAGVSIATVSRVLNSKNNVKDATKERVYSAMSELGYAYSSSNEEKSNLIIMVLPGLDNPFYDKIVQGIQSSCKSHQYDSMMYICKDMDIRYRKLIEYLRIIRAHGIIILSPFSTSEPLYTINEIAPLVQCVEYHENCPFPYVGVDDFSAAKNASQHLINRGRRRIAFINGPQKYQVYRRRYEGYGEAMKSAGLPLEPAYSVHVKEMGYDYALSAASQLLQLKERPDAILAASDVYAAASIKAAAAAGLQVPHDISIIGFDNTYLSSICHPTITAVNLPQFQLGYKAGEMLAERIRNPQGELQNSLLNTELVIRDSV